MWALPQGFWPQDLHPSGSWSLLVAHGRPSPRSQNLIPWLRDPVCKRGLPGLGVPEPGIHISRFHPRTWRGSWSCPKVRTLTSQPGPPVRRGLRLGLLVSNRWTRSGQAEGAATGIPDPLSNRPWDSASAARPAAPAALPAPPRAAALANHREGPAHPLAPLERFNFDGHAPSEGPPLEGLSYRGLLSWGHC